MVQALSSDKVERIARQGRAYESFLTKYFGAPATLGAGPQGFLVEMTTPRGVIRPHFHRVDQFQILVAGGGTVGKHHAEPVAIHYTDGFTPYGPIVASDEGISFYTLRAQSDPGARYMPGSRDKLERRARRGITRESGLVEGAPKPAATPVTLDPVLAPHDDGLAAYTLRLAPNATTTGPDPSASGGQYYIVVNGGVQAGDEWLPPRSLMFVDAGDAAPAVTAGPEGAEVLIAQFPVPDRP